MQTQRIPTKLEWGRRIVDMPNDWEKSWLFQVQSALRETFGQDQRLVNKFRALDATVTMARLKGEWPLPSIAALHIRDDIIGHIHKNSPELFSKGILTTLFLAMLDTRFLTLISGCEMEVAGRKTAASTVRAQMAMMTVNSWVKWVNDQRKQGKRPRVSDVVYANCFDSGDAVSAALARVGKDRGHTCKGEPHYVASEVSVVTSPALMKARDEGAKYSCSVCYARSAALASDYNSVQVICTSLLIAEGAMGGDDKMFQGSANFITRAMLCDLEIENEQLWTEVAASFFATDASVNIDHSCAGFTAMLQGKMEVE